MNLETLQRARHKLLHKPSVTKKSGFRVANATINKNTIALEAIALGCAIVKTHNTIPMMQRTNNRIWAEL